MTDETYTQALRKAKAQLIRAIQEREKLDLEIARLNQLVKALSAELETDKPTRFDAMEETLASGVGFTDVIKSIVNRSEKPMTPKHVRDMVVMSGYDLSRYANPMAMIHQTLKRLAEQNRIREFSDGTYGRTALYEALLKTLPLKK